MWKLVCIIAVIALQGCFCKPMSKVGQTGVETNEPHLLWENSPPTIHKIESDPMSELMNRRVQKYENQVTVKTEITEPVEFVQSLLKLARDTTAAYMEKSLPQDRHVSLNRIIHDSYKHVLGSPDNVF